MSRCKSVLISKIGANKLDKTVEIEFDVNNYLPECRVIRASKRIGGVGTWNMFAVPANQFDCVRQGCLNTGTLYTDGAEAVYQTPADPIDYSAGVVAFYVTGSEGTLTFKIGDQDALTDADQYDVDLSKIKTGDDGYKAVIIDLSQTPTSVIGNGWTPNHTEAYIGISVDPALTGIGISTILIFDEMEDFETSSTVVMACLTTVGSSFDFEAAESTCFGNGGIDVEALDTFEQTVTGKALTPNFNILNPLWGKGESANGFDIETIEAVVEQGVGDDADYGIIKLADKSAAECGWMNVARADACLVTDSHMKKFSSAANRVTIDEQHFFVIDNADGTATIYVNKALVGETLVVRYPKSVEVEEYVLEVGNIEDRTTRMSYTRTYTDGVKYRYVFDNVIITSFPNEITDEEVEFEFTVTIQKDATGRFGRAYRILG